MLAHHQAWLEAHPHRTVEWLKARFKDGFDVHHVDGDRENNSAANLVLIEHTDHMALHGMCRGLGRLGPTRGGGRPWGPKRYLKMVAKELGLPVE